MIDNFIIEKLIELIPIKNEHDLALQNEINQIDFIPKNLNFSQECFRILNKIKKEYGKEEIKNTISQFKKQIVAKSDSKDVLCTLYILTKLIKEDNFYFETKLDSEMAEIDLGISMTSLEIQIEELLKTKLDFENLPCVYKKQPKIIKIEKVQEFQISEIDKKNKNDDIIKTLLRELQEVKQNVNDNQKFKEQLLQNQIQIENFKSQISNLNTIISKIQEENIAIKDENLSMKEEILSLKSRLKILEELNKITDSE